MNSILLDADVIIDLHKLELWEQVTKKNTIYVVTTVIREVEYYDDDLGRHYLDLKNQTGATIHELSATIEEMSQLKNKLNPGEGDNLDPGETDSIATLDKNPGMVFCTFDQLAIIMMVLLDMGRRAISLETLLQNSGLTLNGLTWKSSEKTFQSYIKKGEIRKIQNTDFS